MLSNKHQNALRKSKRLARGANSQLKTVVRDGLSKIKNERSYDMRLVVALGAAVSTYAGENGACVLPGRERNEGEVFCEW